jgi:hypothetical protein
VVLVLIGCHKVTQGLKVSLFTVVELALSEKAIHNPSSEIEMLLRFD